MKRYSTETKIEVFRRLDSGETVNVIANDTGIGTHTILKWRYAREMERAESSERLIEERQIFNWLLAKLPENGQWTRAERDRWVNTYVAMIDLLIEVEEPQ
jgi:hypothetical protein